MARAETVTKLPLDRWAELVQLNPIHFNQCHIPSQQNNQACQGGWFQRDWQDTDRVSREQLASTIAQAEEMIESQLGYRLLPTWEVAEYHSFEGRPNRPEHYNLSGMDVRGRRTGVKLDWGYFVTGGIEAKTLIDDALTITWSDENGDSFKDKGTVVCTVDADTLQCEVELFYPGHAGDARWRIRPITVSIVGITATITFKRELAVLEDLQSGYDVRGVDFTDDAKFLTTVDAYRHYNDPSTQVTLLWENGGCGCLSGACGSCTFNAQTGCLRVRGDDRQSFVAVSPALWDADTDSYSALSPAVGAEPDAVTAYYRAGWRNNSLACSSDVMDLDLAIAVAVLSASLLDRKVCDCRGTEEAVARWQHDTAVQSGATEVKRSVAKSCPFGTTAGALEAWRRINRPGVQKARIGRAILA